VLNLVVAELVAFTGQQPIRQRVRVSRTQERAMGFICGHFPLRWVTLAAPARADGWLKTPHFQTYKSATLNMVKSLKLVDMQAMDGETMFEIFKKITKVRR
jgi:hypothetical protein